MQFNDFVLVGLVCSAVYEAARTAQERDPDEPLTDDDLGRRVVEYLRVEIGDYAQNPDVEYAAPAKVTKAWRESVAYPVWADLRRGWRITMPNLVPPKVPAEGAPPTPPRWRCARWPARSATVAPAPPG